MPRVRRSTAPEKSQFIVLQNMDDGETIVCLPKDLKKVKRLYFTKDSGRDKTNYITYAVYENNVWLTPQHPQLESAYEELAD